MLRAGQPPLLSQSDALDHPLCGIDVPALTLKAGGRHSPRALQRYQECNVAISVDLVSTDCDPRYQEVEAALVTRLAARLKRCRLFEGRPSGLHHVPGRRCQRGVHR